MKGNPLFHIGQLVKFKLQGETKEGTIYIVDEYGTFEDPSDVSYDILVDNCLYKHINENLCIK